MSSTEIDSNRKYFFVKSKFNDREIIKSLFPYPKSKWDGRKKVWIINDDNIDRLKLLFDKFQSTAKARRKLKRLIREHKKFTRQIQLVKDIKSSSELPMLPFMPVKYKPFNHQAKAFEISTTLDHSALLMEQGTGKTLVAIATAGYRHLEEGLRRVLILCPKTVISEWVRQFKETADFPYRIKYPDDSKRSKEWIKDIKKWGRTKKLNVLVMNYESTWRVKKQLQRWYPEMVIVDESQNIKNAQAKQSRTITSIGNKAKYRMILTGTPVSQSPLDFFSQYKFLDSRIFGTVFGKFRDQYAYMGGFGGHQILGYKNLEELARKAHSIAFRVTKEECLDLPESVDQFVYAKLEDKAMKYYEEMREESLINIFGGTVTANIVLTEMLRLQQITGGYVPLDDTKPRKYKQISEAKLKVLEEQVEYLLSINKKIVVFARFRPEIKAIKKLVRDKFKVKTSTIYGGVPSKKRNRRLRRFQKGKAQVMIAQIKTGGVGLNLTMSHTAIFYSLDFSLINYEQAKARLHRAGQDEKVNYIHIVAQGTIDEKVMKNLSEKRNIASFVVDDLKNLI